MVSEAQKTIFIRCFVIIFQKINENLDIIKKLEEQKAEAPSNKIINFKKDSSKKLSINNY